MLLEHVAEAEGAEPDDEAPREQEKNPALRLHLLILGLLSPVSCLMSVTSAAHECAAGAAAGCAG